MAKKILLFIDQDVYYSKIYAHRFEKAGWKVWTEETIEKAKKRLQRNVPDVVILDIISLAETCNFLSSLRANPRTANIIQIILTQFGDRKTMLALLDVGIDQYFLKSHFFPSEAVKKVKHLLEENLSV